MSDVLQFVFRTELGTMPLRFSVPFTWNNLIFKLLNLVTLEGSKSLAKGLESTLPTCSCAVSLSYLLLMGLTCKIKV